jgi:predicted nucleic acid-binding protein
MKLFIDTNILIDLIADRKPFSKWAYRIFKDQKNGKWQLWTSDNSILTTYYIIEKQLGTEKAKKATKIILSRLHIQPIQKLDLLAGLEVPFKDYEDGVKFVCARSIKGISKIITRNKKDFKQSSIEVVSPDELYMLDQ